MKLNIYRVLFCKLTSHISLFCYLDCNSDLPQPAPPPISLLIHFSSHYNTSNYHPPCNFLSRMFKIYRKLNCKVRKIFEMISFECTFVLAKKKTKLNRIICHQQALINNLETSVMCLLNFT